MRSALHVLSLACVAPLACVVERASVVEPAPVAPFAQIVACRSLHYGDDNPAWADRPAHVRAASGLAALGDGLAVIQDDVSFVALLRGEQVTTIELPLAAGGRRRFDDELGNRAQKPDLEAIVSLDSRVVMFGSGSTTLRQSIVVANRDGTVEVFDGSALYDAARGRPELAGTTLNIEGALVRGGALYWFQRGNGGATERPLNAVVELDLAELEAWLGGGRSTPSARAVRKLDLGDVDGVPLGFTDATMVEGQTLFVAVAEASPGVVHDGRVTGVRLGRLGVHDVELAMVMEADGTASLRKLEGIWPHPERPGAILAVADADDPARAAELCEVRLPFEWRGVARRRR